MKVLHLEQVLREQGELIRPVVGTSMMPLLDQKRDAVHLVPVEGELSVGDVPLFRRRASHYVLHRICAVEKNHYIVRGDNCHDKEPVRKERMVAVMDGFYKDGKFISVTDPSYRAYVQKVLAAGKPLIAPENFYLLALIRAAMCDTTPPPLPQEVTWEGMVALCKRQKVSAIVARAVGRVCPPPPQDIEQAFARGAAGALRREILFENERAALTARMEAACMRYLPLKGVFLSPLYPEPGMREFSDNDILYDAARRRELIHLMEEAGYKCADTLGVHDTFEKPPVFCFEMHRALLDETGDRGGVFRDIWSRAVADTSDPDRHYAYRMRDEDFFLFFLAHFAKHYRTAGGGLRMIIDLYILRRRMLCNPAFDHAYVERMLARAGLADFAREADRMCDGVFSREEPDLPDEVMRRLFCGGAFGSTEEYVRSKLATMSRARYLLYRLFLPYDEMCLRYPVLKKCPPLLPLFWLLRPLRLLLPAQRRRNREEMEALRRIRL